MYHLLDGVRFAKTDVPDKDSSVTKKSRGEIFFNCFHTRI